MEISCSSSRSCFELALDYLGWLDDNIWCGDLIWKLEEGVRLLQSFDLYLTMRRRRNHETCLEQDEKKDVTSSRIQDLITRRMPDLEFACSEYLNHSRSPDSTRVKSELTMFLEAIKLFFETDINESCINYLLDCYWLRDPELVIDFIDSVSETLEEIDGSLFNRPDEKLMFLKSFIHFVMLLGVEDQQLIHLLIHTEVVAIKALRLASIWWFNKGIDNDKVCKKMELQMSRLIEEKIIPGDPWVRETYIHVLTAAKSSRSSGISALEKNEHLVADFMGYLVPSIIELVESCTSTLAPIMNQILKLLEGLRFLTILLRHQKRFKELCHEMKNLIGVVVCDTAIIIFSLYENQIKEGLVMETNVALLHLVKVLNFIRAEVIDPVTSVSGFGFPRTNELGSMDFLLTNLKELARCDEINGSNALPGDKIQTIQKDFDFLRSFLEKIKEQRNQNEKLQAFWSRVMEIAYKAELVIDWTLVGDGHEYFLDDVARDINVMKTEAQEIYDSISYVGETTKAVTKTFTRMPSQVTVSTYNEDLVPLDDVVKTITDSLTRGGSRQLDVVPIVGMPGLGKTTLANIIYNSRSVMLHFHIRAWCTVSQAYNMHNMLVQILDRIESGKLEQYQKMDEADLAVKLKQVLLRNKYLLVLDDLWDAKAWNLLERSLPDAANGSRILITSRIQLQFKPDSKVHHLRHLTDEESWNLLQKKLFGKKGCPPRLNGVASQIVKLCRGLPLTVVLVAGILANTAENFWEEVAKNLTSSIILDDEDCMKTLELSYSHLPDDLKACLLYFGAFKEDEIVSFRILSWLWISEGFVRKTEEKNLEDVADDYLQDLVDRSLVMVSKQRTMGGAKACQLHDLVHEFCVKKAEEENFLHILHGQNGPFVLAGPSYPLRVCDRSARNLMIRESMLEFPNVRSLLLFKEEDLGFWFPKLLRVLDLGELEFGAYFPVRVFLLAHLRYLALRARGVKFIPAAIANLSRLRTFLLRGNNADCLLPKTIWNIKTLRHLWITNSNAGFFFPVENLQVSPGLDHLDTLSLAVDPSSQSLQKILTKLPNIRSLRCTQMTSTRLGDRILVFDCFSQLESLTLSWFDSYGFKFPLNLKKLTLFFNKQPRSEISTIGKLPNLEVLKLLQESVVGEEWEMKEGEFPNLRVLKLSCLGDFRSWTASSDNFPRLEKLVVELCEKLEEVPFCLGECPALEMIEVRGCHESVANSVKQIQQEQIDMGNEALKILIEDCVDPSSPSEEEEEESSPSETESIPAQQRV